MRAALPEPSSSGFLLLLLPLLATACASGAPTSAPPASAPRPAGSATTSPSPNPNAACLAPIKAPPGFAPRDDDGTVARLCGAPDKGNFWQAGAFVSTEPVRVYRLYSEHQDPHPGIPGRKAGRYGRWWSTEKPTATRQQYREAYAVCAEWNDLDVLVTCTLPANTPVGIGTSQSVQCPSSGHLAQSATIQIVVPDAPKLEQTGACSSTPWPG